MPSSRGVLTLPMRRRALREGKLAGLMTTPNKAGDYLFGAPGFVAKLLVTTFLRGPSHRHVCLRHEAHRRAPHTYRRVLLRTS
jgi:hypothetical protein